MARLSNRRPTVWVALALLLGSQTTMAQVRPDQLLDERVMHRGLSEGASEVGDQIDTSNGALHFRQVDASVPGNSALEVLVARTYSATEKRSNAAGSLAFGDWEFDLPRIHMVSHEWVNSDAMNSNARCSVNTLPAALPPDIMRGRDHMRWGASPYHYWSPPALDIAEDKGLLLIHDAGAPVPANGSPTKWVTTARTAISCLPTIRNGVGEGFLALAANGNKYRFDWLAKKHVAHIVGPVGSGQYLDRHAYSMYATRVEDRFGNWVEYDFANSADGARLSAIRSSDGRRIDVHYTAQGLVDRVLAHGRAWRYGYGVVDGRTVLGDVTLPDESKWRFELAGLDRAARSVPVVDEHRCNNLTPALNANEFVGALTSPAGLRAEFTVRATRFGRSNVPKECVGGNDSAASRHIVTYGSFAVVRKTMQGPGVAPLAWTYKYVSTYGFAPSNGSNVTEIVAPDGSATRYHYGNTHAFNDGLLIAVDRLTPSGAVLETRVNDYGIDVSTIAVRAGTSPSLHRLTFNEENIRPLRKVTTTRGGSVFSWNVETFDAWARPTRIRRGNDFGGVSTEVTTYHDNMAKWVLGEVAATKNLETNQFVSQTAFDPANAMPLKTYAFGKLRQTFTYRADGTVASISDGRDSASVDTTVSFSQFKRGVPQHIAYPDGTSRSAVVDDLGQVQSITDETGAKTCHAFDAMGRLSSITYPSEAANGVCDASSWNRTTRSVVQATSAAYGLPAGHWRELVSTGNAKHEVFYDALWRPVLTSAHDAADTANTRSMTITRYDAIGRPIDRSYPARSVSNIDQALPGTRTTYDALGRVVRIEQDSEIGPLTTTSSFLKDAKGPYVLTTNPRSYQTRTWFQMFDEPDYDRPTVILHPAGAITDIARDVFGKPTAITRRNADRSLSSSRIYAYYPTQELCRVDEPEAGSTYMGYDAAGNLAWSASGNASGATCANATDVAARRSDRTYDNRNRITSLRFADGWGNTTYIYTGDGLPSVQAVDNGGAVVTTTYGYNKRRLPTTELMAWDSIHWTLGYAYDANAHLASQSYPANLTVDYAPNALGQPTRAGPYATGVTHHPNGAIATFIYGNGLRHEAYQNARKLPERSRDFHGATSIHDEGYDYDQNGNVVAISDGATGGTTNRDMIYDGLDRLTTMKSPMLGGSGGIYYGYDVLDNVVSVSSPARSQRFCYEDGTNRLTMLRAGATVPCSNAAAAMTALLYDPQGNVQSKNNLNFQFGQNNRLRSTTGAVASSYVYDATGRRVRDYTTGSRYHLYSRAGQVALTSDARSATTTNYVYLGKRLIAERSSPNGTTNYTVKYQHVDALGTPVAVTDTNRAVIERSHYEPFGKLLNRPLQDGLGFTGHVEDAATGLSNMQQRYYDDDLFRFLSVDPVSTDTTTAWNHNRYNYAANNPYKFKDPDGRLIETAWDAASFGMGLANLAGNVRSGNWGGAAVDSLGLLLDGAAILTPGVPGGASAAIGAVRGTQEIGNMGEFLKNSEFGQAIAGSLRPTSQRVDGQKVFKVTKNVGALEKGDQLYLDGMHKDHMEVFDKHGDAKSVLNMDGTINKDKSEAAQGRRLPRK